MNMFNNIKSFFSDKDYTVSICQNKLYIFNYKLLPKFTSKEINIKFETMFLMIDGTNLKITKMEEKELLIEGDIINLRFKYE